MNIVKFQKYVDQKRGKEPRRAFIGAFAKQSGVSRSTLQACMNGYRMDSYSKAKAISEATRNRINRCLVTIKDLCDP